MNMNTEKGAITLGALLERCGGMLDADRADMSLPVVSVEYNSSRVMPGSLFAAIEGFQSDGHKYIEDAVKRGATAVALSAARKDEFVHLADRGVALLYSRNTRVALSRVSAAFYGFPASNVTVIGVTGTNGKTSITYMLESIFRAHGHTPGVIGTVNYRWKGHEVPAPNTTPESKDLQELMFLMTADGVDVIIMEVSSHGLKLSRADDIAFNAGIFTNLTRDHLDFHETFEDYYASKRRLFSLLDGSAKGGKAGVVNADDEYGLRILSGADGFGYPLLSFGLGDGAAYRPLRGSIVNTIEGISYVIDRPVRDVKVDLHVTGTFHVYNSLCAFACAHALGVPVPVILRGLSDISTIPGRFDRIRSPEGFHAVVDYAHTDDALSKLLQSARELGPRRLITIFGCGGNRDKTKRPLMGRSATELSDWVIVTSDNPRNEQPLDIIRDIVAGIARDNYEVEPDREAAISKAVAMAREGDLVVVAGKGHEDYQIIGGEKRHFDDGEMIRKYMDSRRAG